MLRLDRDATWNTLTKCTSSILQGSSLLLTFQWQQSVSFCIVSSNTFSHPSQYLMWLIENQGGGHDIHNINDICNRLLHSQPSHNVFGLGFFDGDNLFYSKMSTGWPPEFYLTDPQFCIVQAWCSTFPWPYLWSSKCLAWLFHPAAFQTTRQLYNRGVQSVRVHSI